MNKKLKITFLTPDFSNESIQDSGGASKSVYLIIKTLSEMGHIVRVISVGKSDFEGMRRVNDLDVFVREIKKSKFDPPVSHLVLPKLVAAMLSLEKETDIFHFYNVNYDYVSFYYKLISKNRKKIVSTLNNYSSICPNYSCMYKNELNYKFNLKQRIDNLSEEYGNGFLKNLALSIYALFFPLLFTKPSKSCDGYIALRKQIKEIYQANDFKNISIIPNVYESTPDDEVKADKRDKTVLFVGRVKKSKGLEFLIEAFLDCKDKSYQLVVVGEGPALKEIKNKFSGFAGITFRGKVRYGEIGNFYKKSEIFVHPGQWPEPFARTIIESINNGCKTLVSDISSPEIIIKDDLNKFDYKNKEDLTNKLNLLMGKNIGFIPKDVLLPLNASLVTQKIVEKYLSLI